MLTIFPEGQENIRSLKDLLSPGGSGGEKLAQVESYLQQLDAALINAAEKLAMAEREVQRTKAKDPHRQVGRYYKLIRCYL